MQAFHKLGRIYASFFVILSLVAIGEASAQSSKPACISDKEIVKITVRDLPSTPSPPCTLQGQLYFQSITEKRISRDELEGADWAPFAMLRFSLTGRGQSQELYRLELGASDARLLQIALVDHLALELSEHKRIVWSILLADVSERVSTGSYLDVFQFFEKNLLILPGFKFYKEHQNTENFARSYLYCFAFHNVGNNSSTDTARSISFRECLPKWSKLNE